MGGRIQCEHASPLYREVKNSKQNGKILEKGNIRIGKDYYLDIKTNMVCKIK